jgi:hypothetical protein
MWDVAAKLLAIKAIGTVESGLAYAAINASDPITVGILQWYGTRAAAILRRMQIENAGQWTAISSIDGDLAAHPDNDGSYWTGRFLTSAEIVALRPNLATNIAIQQNQAILDLDGYAAVATTHGMNVNTNTDAFIFFAVMYHQSPIAAFRVLSIAGPSSDINRLYSYALNDTVLSRYRSRYATAKEIILSHDFSGVDIGNPVTDNPGGNNGIAAIGSIHHVALEHDHMRVYFDDGHSVLCMYDGRSRWLARPDDALGSPILPVIGDGTHAGQPPAVQRTALVDFISSLSNIYAYSQGPGRLDPVNSGYTDCSGLVRYVYLHVCGIDVGGWTGEQIGKGILVTIDKNIALSENNILPGDLLFIRWNSNSPSTYDHVEMYAGNNTVWGHGGPDNGPDMGSWSSKINASATIMVRRYVS